MVNLGSEVGRRIALNKLNRAYGQDSNFAHMLERAQGVVPGDGPVAPPLMFVGEAPGRAEDKQRKPFVGASGKFLNELLESVGLKRESVYITNAVKIRPVNERGGNRPPTDEELHASIPYLRREHSLLDRPPIVMLGKHAKHAAVRLDRRALQLPTLGGSIGEWFWMGEYPMLPLYHPAYGIYQQANRPMMFEQFKAVLHPPKEPL